MYSVIYVSDDEVQPSNAGSGNLLSHNKFYIQNCAQYPYIMLNLCSGQLQALMTTKMYMFCS